jgi:hypothetical protein
MRQIEPTHTAVQTDTADITQKRIYESQTRPVRFKKLMRYVYAVLILALIVTVYILAHKNFSSQNVASDPLPLTVDEGLEVEVLDGAGSMKVAQYVTNILRSKGYDVVEMKRNNDGIVERTYVIDRSGNLEVARKLAEILGIASDKVFQKIDRNLYLDVTVVVGKDFSKLKVFQAFNERSKH